MKKIFYSVGILTMLGYAGGDVLPVDTSYESVIENVVVEPAPIKVMKAPVVTPPTPVVLKEVTPVNLDYYVGLALGVANVSGVTSSVNMENAVPLLATAKLGYNVSENFALEGRFGKGVKDDEVNAVATSEVDQVAGIYLKPNIKIMDDLNLFALLGYANAKQKINADVLETKGVSYGAGIAYGVTEAVDIVVDAVRYGKEDTETVDAYSLGVNYNF